MRDAVRNARHGTTRRAKGTVALQHPSRRPEFSGGDRAHPPDAAERRLGPLKFTPTKLTTHRRRALRRRPRPWCRARRNPGTRQPPSRRSRGPPVTTGSKRGGREREVGDGGDSSREVRLDARGGERRARRKLGDSTHRRVLVVVALAGDGNANTAGHLERRRGGGWGEASVRSAASLRMMECSTREEKTSANPSDGCRAGTGRRRGNARYGCPWTRCAC